MQYYSYNDIGCYTGTGTCQRNPVGGGYLVPRNATLVQPPAVQAGQAAIFDGSEWAVQPEPECMKRERAKEARQIALDGLIVTLDGRDFDGDEISQGRMLRAIKAMEIAGDTEIKWVLADNSVEIVTLEELKNAFTKANQAQAELWVLQ